MYTFIATIANMDQLLILDILPEAICCCLQTYTVTDVLLVMCLPAFFVTSADLCYLLGPRLFVVV